MENFKFKLKFSSKIIAILIISSAFLNAGESTIFTYIDNYTKSIYTLPAIVQIRLTNYLLIVNALEPLAENGRIDSSLDNLIMNSDSESVRHHAKIVKLALSNNRPEIFNYQDQTHRPKNSKEKILLQISGLSPPKFSLY